MLVAPRTIAAKKFGFRSWALALARLDIRCALRTSALTEGSSELPLLAGVRRAWTGSSDSAPGVSLDH